MKIDDNHLIVLDGKGVPDWQPWEFCIINVLLLFATKAAVVQHKLSVAFRLFNLRYAYRQIW